MNRTIIFNQVRDGIRPVSAPAPEAYGPTFPISSVETAWFWTPALGPTAIIMLMQLDDVGRAMPGFVVTWANLAPQVGLGPLQDDRPPGINHPVVRSLHRILNFCQHVTLTEDVLFLPTELPLPPLRQRGRWSELTRWKAAAVCHESETV